MLKSLRLSLKYLRNFLDIFGINQFGHMVSLFFFSFSSFEMHKKGLTDNMEDSITCTDVGKKSIAKAFSLMGSFYQSSNVNYIQKCRNFAGKEKFVNYKKESLIFHLYHKAYYFFVLKDHDA